MEPSSSSTSRFRFRDRQEMVSGDASEGHTSPDYSSVSSDADEDPEIESMTGQGIKHLCSELFELKRISDEDFHENIFSNYSAFVSIFKEVEGMENELMQLKYHVSTQKKLVKELINGIYLKVMSKETVESIIEDPMFVETSPHSILEAHAYDVSEALDILLAEQRLDEALEILELEAGTFQGQENLPSDVLTCYNSAISERRARIADQLKQVAANPRVSAPELLKALSGLRRLGDSLLATQLLLQYYHYRIATGIHDLQYSKSLNGGYIRDVAKFVFSMISQAAKSILVLHEETSYSSEFMHWACDKTELFAACFNKYVRSISEISGGLVTLAEAVQSAFSYCSLLETQEMVLLPCLVKHVRPCVEEVLQVHIDHFKKVIGIFTSTDAWVVGKYLPSGILGEACSVVVVGQQLEYCLLTNSGRKFVTMLQAITKDLSPLVGIQMEGSILRGLMDLFIEYVAILESALTGIASGLEKGRRGVNLAESPEQEVSIVANLSTLVHLFSTIVRIVFKGINHLNFEVDSFIVYIQEASDQLRAHFCQKFICRTMYGSDCRFAPETWVGGQSASDASDQVMPSIFFQGLFFELSKYEKLAEDDLVEVNVLLEHMRELMEAIVSSILNNEEMWTTTEENLAVQHCGNFKQVVLDMQFLLQIARAGGYFTDNILTASLALLSRMKSIFTSAGLDATRDMIDEGWARTAATEALQKLQEMKETKSPPNETMEDLEMKTKEDHSGHASDSFEDDGTESSWNFVESADSVVIKGTAVVFTTDTEVTAVERVADEEDGGSNETSYVNSVSVPIKPKERDAETPVGAMTNVQQKTQSPKSSEKQQLSVGTDGKNSGALSPQEDHETRSPLDWSEQVIYELEGALQTGLAGTYSSEG